jgi:hypothetical protein
MSNWAVRFAILTKGTEMETAYQTWGKLLLKVMHEFSIVRWILFMKLTFALLYFENVMHEMVSIIVGMFISFLPFLTIFKPDS